MSLHWIRYGLGLLLVVLMLGHAGKQYQIEAVARVEAITYDAKVRLTMPQTVDDRVVIVDIDEKSLGEQGRWPWGRDKLATLINTLFDRYGVQELGFDVVFAEADDSSGLRSLERLGKKELSGDASFQNALQALRPQLDNDARFVDAIKRHRVILGYAFSNTGIKTGALPTPVMQVSDFLVQPRADVFKSYSGNLERFQAVAAGAGHFNPAVDPDGINRRVPMLIEQEGKYYETLSLAMVRQLLGSPKLAAGYPEEVRASFKPGDYAAVEWLEMAPAGGTRIAVPVDARLNALIPYRGLSRSYPYISATDVINQRVKPEALAGKIVLVGTTAPGLLDLRATPVEGVYPGVEIHANLITGMLDGTMKSKPDYVIAVDILILLVAGAIMIFLVPRFAPLYATLATSALVAAICALNFALWQYANILLPLANSLILVAWLFALNMSWGYFIESRSKRQFTALFGQYVPPELVDEMARNPESYSMEGRRAELTVLFSDVRGFTTISEGLQPEELATLMNEYLGAMTAVVQRHRGTLDKYIGDAIMAFWGAPVDDPHHARHALLTAIEMQAALIELNKTLVAKGWPSLAIGVGVNTGQMTVGDMGSPVRKSYTVMGDAVNLGSRLEGITKEYGVGIIVGEQTRAALRHEFVFRELDRVRVKGKDEAISIYEPIGLEGSIAADMLEELKLWNQFLRQYRSQDWDQAELSLMNLQRMAPRYLYEKYAEAVAAYRAAPPGADWDGVTVFKTK